MSQALSGPERRTDQRNAERRVAQLARLKRELPLFAQECLKIKDKAGDLVPLIFNRAQWHLHQRAEAQRARIGRVRQIIGKGRQTTCTTYISGRFYHQTTLNKGVETFILTHEQDATDHLFDIVSRFHEHAPFRPHTAYDNAKELTFDRLDSGYAVGTAGSKAVGRSRTVRLLHGSEAAFWTNASAHFAGVVQAVPELFGTEIWIESTGNGPAGEFYERVQRAIRGDGTYEFTFIPTSWAADYQAPIPPGFAPTEDEEEFQRTSGCAWEHIVWRRDKLADMRDPELYRQEYPETPDEMFQQVAHDAFIPAELVARARRASCDGIGPLVIGADPARKGGDRFSIAWRRGRKVSKVESRRKLGTVEALAWLRSIIDADRPARVFLDAGGGGDRLFDILTSWGPPYSNVVRLVNFGGRPLRETRIERDGTKHAGPKNRRAEMWADSKAWLEQEGGADIPDMDSLQADATAPGYHHDTRDQALVLESKEDIERRLGFSPDEWDAIALTFAEPVHDRLARAQEPERPMEATTQPGQGWMAR